MIRYAIRCVLLVIAIATFPTPALSQQAAPSAAQSAERLTLEEAITLALKHNRLIKNEELEVEKVADRVAITRTRLLPQFDVSLLGLQLLTPLDFRFRKGAFGFFPGLGPVPATNTTITTPLRPTAFMFARATQPLSQLPRIGLGIKLQETSQELAENKLKSQQQSVANQVKNAYYRLLRQQSALSAMEESIKLYHELDRLVGRYVVEQIALDGEHLEIKTKLAREEYEALTLRNSLASQKEQLNTILGRDLQTDFTVSPLPEGTLYEVDLNSARARALQQRPELQEAKLKLKQAQFDERMKKSEAIPDVSLIFGFIGAWNVDVLPQNTAAIGVQMNWEPFDWGRKKRELAEKKRTLEQVNNALLEVESQILLEVNLRFRKLEEARALLRVTQLQQETVREKLRVATNKFSQDAVLLRDVLQAQTAVAEANNQYQQALLAFWTARADFEKALGES